MRRNPTIRSSPARGARERRRRRPGLDRLEARLTPTTIDPNAIPTVGVYDENAVNTNAVDFVATGSSVTNTQFAADVASAYARDLGGVINGSVLGSLHGYGVDHNKMLTVSSPTNWGIGQGPAISGTGSFSTVSPNYNKFTLNFGSITNGAAGERVVEFGITAMSYGEDYGNVTVTGNLSGGGTL